MEIIQIEFESDEAKQLLHLFNSEWHDLKEFEKIRSGLSIPEPLVAVQGDSVLGGASFTAYVEPDGEDVVVWLNALYVAPEFRGEGIASKLVKAAMRISPELFALTDIPGLYTKLGWRVRKEAKNGTVVYT